MAFAIDYRRSLAALAAFLSASILFWFGNDLDPWWPLLWFAPLPILLFASRSSWWSAALTAALSLLVGSLSMWHYFRVLQGPFAVWAGVYSIAALVFAAAVLLFRALLLRGAWWSALLALPAPPDQHVTVALLASDEPTNTGVAEEGPATERLFRDYAREAEKLAAQGAQVIVLPEKLGVVVDPDNRASDAIFQSLADKTKSTIVAGLVHVSPPAKYNQARVYAPGAPVLRYDKQHMLPPFESNLKPGTTLTLMPEQSRIWGVAICKDMDFTQLSCEYGEAGAGLMLVPAWDFNVDQWWHGHIAVIRGVESGFSIARAAKNGYLTVSDNRGRILAETRTDSAPFATLVAQAPAIHDTTLYLLLGDWFAWLALATLVFALVQLYS